tara:strand:+ start:125 stop:424 length:300 start_codon:yes stop_codon:yes gene_type:complete
MKSILLIFILIIVFFVLLFCLFFYSRQNKRSEKKTIFIPSSIPSLKEQEFNPDINTESWDLHKLRLEKFKRSQYKGLTFFVNSENRIYYLSGDGDKVYC